MAKKTVTDPIFAAMVAHADEVDIRKHFAERLKLGPEHELGSKAGKLISKVARVRDCRAEQREASKRLRKAQRERKRLQDKHGWTAHERRYEETNAAEQKALMKFSRTVPTTAEGIAVLADWCVEHHNDVLQGTRWDPTEIVFATIAQASRKLAQRTPLRPA